MTERYVVPCMYILLKLEVGGRRVDLQTTLPIYYMLGQAIGLFLRFLFHRPIRMNVFLLTANSTSVGGSVILKLHASHK